MPSGMRTPQQIRADLEAEQEQLAVAVEHLRDSIGEASDLRTKLKGKLPLIAGGAASVGFVFGGGIGATMRYFARRGREHTERVRVGRLSVYDRD
jgi:hypothetical protein